MKPKRKKVYREWLENQLAKYERRIQKLAENAYQLRQAITLLDNQEAARTTEKGDTNALHTVAVESAVGSRGTDTNIGESKLPDIEAVNTFLDEQQPTVPGH